MLLLYFTLFTVAGLVKAQTQCLAVMHASDLRQCFRMRDIKYVVVHQQDDIIDTSLSIEGFLYDPAMACESQQKFAELFDCLSGATTKCFTEDLHKFIPDSTLTEQGLAYLCQHANVIDKDCYNHTYDEVFACVRELSREIIKGVDDIFTKACTSVDIIHDCIKAKVLCGASTQEILLKFQDEHRKPIGCPAPARHGRKLYITTGSSTTACVSTFLLILLSLLATLAEEEL